jgi:transcriptional regulator with XRE-family HTH domain
MNNSLTSQQIGKTVKLIRELRNYSQDWVAKQAGYKDKTTYSRFESGKLKKLDFNRFQSICHAINCNSVQIILLTSLESFNYRINSWDEFIDSLKNMDQFERQEMLDLLKGVFPVKYDEILNQLEAMKKL